MRVALAGSSGTGKSELAKFVAERFGLEQNPIGSRLVAKHMGYDSPYDVDKAGRRFEFQWRLLTEKTQWEIGRDAFVTDRTTADNLAYTIMHMSGFSDENSFTLFKCGLKRYTHVFFTPMSAFWDTAGDPARVHDRTYHEVYETIVRGLLDRYLPSDVVLTVVDVADLAERKRLVESVLFTAR